MKKTQDILTFIETQRAQGTPRERIQTELMRAGWPEDEIQKAFLVKAITHGDDEGKSFVAVMQERATKPVNTRLSITIIFILIAFLSGLVLYEYWYAPNYVWAHAAQSTAQVTPANQ